MIRKYGYKPDIPDNRDYTANLLVQKEVFETATPVIAPIDCIVDVLDQKDLGSCVINAGLQLDRMTAIKELKLVGLYKTPPPLGSRLKTYYEARAADGVIDYDEGTTIRTFFKVVNKYGSCSESYWPYNTNKWNNFPPPLAQQHAFDNRDSITYRRITETGNEKIAALKAARVAGYAVVFGTTVGKDFANYAGKPLDPPNFADELGGHALLCVDVLPDDNFLILNSWGSNYGDKGYCVFTAAYMAWYNTRDLYIIDKALAIKS